MNRAPSFPQSELSSPVLQKNPDSIAPADQSARPASSGSEASSTSSHPTSFSVRKRPPYSAVLQLTTTGLPRAPSGTLSSPNSGSPSLPNFSRPSAPFLSQNDPSSRKASRLAPPHDLQKHRPRQHSQGFFEPSLPTAALSEHSTAMANLSASQIAAQAAMQHQTASQNLRNQSQTTQSSQDNVAARRSGARDSPPPTVSGQLHQDGVVGGRVSAATTAANVVFPRNPGLPSTSQGADHGPETGHKHKGEKSKIKLFSKPKHIGISGHKDADRKDKPLPSPNRIGFPGASGLSRMINASTTSLTDSITPSNSSMYNLSNSSVTTVVQLSGEKEKDKEKVHKHHFLSRQKLKLKDKDDHFNLPLSSASSNSKPLDPSAPQSLYSFAPSSPSSTTFGKSMSGLDLWHGGRALREKKKEEKASAAAAQDSTLRDTDPADWPGNGVAGSGTQPVFIGPASLGSSGGGVHGGEAALREALQGFGLHNMTPEDAWDFLKAKLLVLFEGEDVRIALEDLNKLVSVHIQCCVQKLNPSMIVEDLRDLLHTGFASLNHTIHSVPDERLIPHLVQMWLFVFGTVLPFIQAVFLPLDLEFKGRGSIMTAREAKEFWGALPNGDSSNTSMGDELDVRNIVLVSFRDTVILTRYEVLKATFSRLSLESINANVSATPNSRPGTASALDPSFGSYSSQSSTLLNTAGSFSSDSVSTSMSRSRAASNTSSNPDQVLVQPTYSSLSPPQNSLLAQASSQTQIVPPHPAHAVSKTQDPSLLVTETVGRMLQCISVLASVQTDDKAQEKVEVLSKALKHNWLGRGRTGRDRRGFVGTRVRPVASAARKEREESSRGSGDGSGDESNDDSEDYKEG